MYSLDYFFDLSDWPDAIQRENIVLAYNSEPAQGDKGTWKKQI